MERFGHRVHAFCLMTNHVHLAVQIADIPLARIMQNLSFRYTRWINGRQNRSGHLFQGRYKAVLVDADSYLLQLVRYLHLNPVRANMVASPDDYPWSSHRAYCGVETIPWLTTEITLSMLATNRERAVRAYVDFIREELTQERRPEFHGEGVADSRVFGDDEFVERMVGDEVLSARVSLADILAGICRHYGTSLDELVRPGKERTAAGQRAMAAWIVQDVASVTLTELAERTGREVATLSAAALRLQKRATAEPELLRIKAMLVSQILKCKA